MHFSNQMALLGAISVACASNPAETGHSHMILDIVPPQPTSPPNVHRRDADLACASSVGTELRFISTVAPALSSYLEEHALENLGSPCTLTVPLNLTGYVKSVWSAEKTWASTISSKAAGIHTDCGNGGPITLPITNACTDGATVVGTAEGQSPQTASFTDFPSSIDVVISSAHARPVPKAVGACCALAVAIAAFCV